MTEIPTRPRRVTLAYGLYGAEKDADVTIALLGPERADGTRETLEAIRSTVPADKSTSNRWDLERSFTAPGEYLFVVFRGPHVLTAAPFSVLREGAAQTPGPERWAF